jgi:hypothetical protein
MPKRLPETDLSELSPALNDASENDPSSSGLFP